MRIYLFLIILSAGFISACGQQLKHYDLQHPDQILELPEVLHEISGITFINDETFACVQDENGILFIYDIVLQQITESYPFHADGDYEGITRAGNSIYILRSDGKIYDIKNYETDASKVKSYVTHVPAANNEGLCYDIRNDRLLIGCKNKIDKKSIPKDTRQIYAFDIEKKELKKDPVFQFDEDDVKNFADKHDIAVPGLTDKKSGLEFKFNISAIAVHPLNNKLFVLDAADHLLFVLDKKSRLDNLIPLDPALFNKPEGITFDRHGTIYVTNEGQTGKARLLVFKRK